MMLSEACQILGVYDMALNYATVLSMSGASSMPVDNILSTAKTNFKRLALKCHPDTGGSPEKFLELNQAFELVNSAQIPDFVLLLRSAEKRYTPGDENCKTCTKWNGLAKMCMTISCTGHKRIPGTT